MAALPQKKYYRQRAHSNPMADHTFDYPVCPEDMDWSAHYPDIISSEESTQANNYDKPRVEFADIGCGYGGLLGGASSILKIALRENPGIEVSDYVNDRILALRQSSPGQYQNISIIRTNAMKYLPNFFEKGQGLAYFITDVQELYDWMSMHFNKHPLFEEVSKEEMDKDIVVEKLYNSSEEGQKVSRTSGIKLLGVYRRIADPDT